MQVSLYKLSTLEKTSLGISSQKFCSMMRITDILFENGSVMQYLFPAWEQIVRPESKQT